MLPIAGGECPGRTKLFGMPNKGLSRESSAKIWINKEANERDISVGD